MLRPYSATCVQSIIRKVKSKASKEATIRENLYRNLSLIDNLTNLGWAPPKLFAFPEFFLQGFPSGESLAEWLEVAIRIPGEETEVLAACARAKGIYLAAHAYEVDDEWPGRVFNTAFIIDPKGEIILRYRKLNSPVTTTPGDIFTAYLERYGIEGIFPVAETPLGKLACMICYDVNFPEVARCLAMRGAEVILHLTGEPHGGYRDSWDCAKRARAYENLVYIVSPNHGMYLSPIDDERFADASGLLFQDRQAHPIAPMFRSYGHSKIIGPDGKILAEVNGPGEAAISAPIDIEALRYRRAQPGMNFLAQVRAGLFAKVYEQTELYPLNTFAKEPMKTLWQENSAITRQAIAGMIERGIYVAPSEG